MSRKIYTYTNIESLVSSERYNVLRQLPHITATTGLQKAMKHLYGDENLVPIIAMRRLVECIIGEWGKPAIKFRQYIKLAEIIRNYLQDNTGYNKEFVLGFKRNQKEVLNAIRTLVEANVYPEEIKVTNEEEKFFQMLWKRFEQEDVAADRYRNKMYLTFEDEQVLRKHLKSIFNGFNYNQIILHGFYFITPVQERVIQLLEQNGIEIIFLNCFNFRLPEVHRIWLENFSVERGYEPVENWVHLQEETNGLEGFGKLFEGKIKDLDHPAIQIKRYSNDMEFISDLKEIEKEAVIYTTDKNSAEVFLREVFPEKFKERHLLAYPVGQFLYYLHLMWNDIRGELVFEFEYLVHCFASGWVYKDGLQGKDYLYELEKMKTYFKGCTTLDEWERRLENLEQASSNVVNLFDFHLSQVNEEHKRWHHLMGNPFINFSVFTIDKERINNIIILLKHLMMTAKELFGNKDEIELDVHFKRLSKLLREREDKQSTLQEEQIIINELFKRLQTENKILTKCFPGDIAEAMILLLGGGFSELESFEDQAGNEDCDFINPIYQIEASSVICKIQNKKKVHLCMCDEELMPGGIKKYPWPITEDLLTRLQLEKRSLSRRLIDNFKFIIEHNPLCNRYLFYSLLQNQEVEISWIAEKKSKEIDASAYIKLLYIQYGLEPVKSEVNKITKDVVEEIVCKDKVTNSLEVDMLSEVPSEVKMEAALCSKRYLYSYVLQEYPAYVSEFHYNFALARLIAGMASTTEMPTEIVGGYILELFPYLRYVEKKQILDYVGKKQDYNSESYDGISYTDARLGIHFLKESIRHTAEKYYEECIEGKRFKVLIDGSKSGRQKDECMFCPHIQYCVDSVFPIDKENHNER